MARENKGWGYFEHMTHYHHERNHQGLGNALIDGEEQEMAGAGRIVCRERLSGLLGFHRGKTAAQERIEQWDRTPRHSAIERLHRAVGYLEAAALPRNA